MKKISEPIVFFGSGPVAAESLRLLAEDFTVEAVITKPRPVHHRGDVPVLRVAEQLDLPVKTAASGSELDALFEGHPLKSRVAILIDFGIIVSQKVIDYFPLGVANSHFSVLPEWRGADPITFAILSGQKQTGVSLMLLVKAMDEGPLLAHDDLAIPANATTPELTEALIKLSDKLLKYTLPLYLSGVCQPIDQSITGRQISYSRKLTKEDGLLDWSKPAAELEREIRAFIEWPKSRTSFGDLAVVVTGSHVVQASGKPGSRTIIDKLPVVYCGDQALALDRLKPAGKQEMTGQAFLAGYRQQFIG
jgi:methionyl-tRNA formyltransferase